FLQRRNLMAGGGFPNIQGNRGPAGLTGKNSRRAANQRQESGGALSLQTLIHQRQFLHPFISTEAQWFHFAMIWMETILRRKRRVFCSTFRLKRSTTPV